MNHHFPLICFHQYGFFRHAFDFGIIQKKFRFLLKSENPLSYIKKKKTSAKHCIFSSL